jgi:excisionase family DNA binding protein
MPKTNKPLLKKFDQLPDWVSPEEARSFLGVGRTTMYQLLNDDEIPSRTFGRQKRIPKEALRPAAK